MTETIQALDRPEQVRLAVDVAVSAAMDGSPEALGEVWASIRELQGRAQAAKDFATELAAKAKEALSEADLMEQSIKSCMESHDLVKLSCGYGMITVKANGGSQAVTVTGVVPEEFQTVKQTTSNNLKLIGEKLRAGEILSFAALEPRGSHVELTPS